ncbi:MAG: ATP-binding protein [Desulfobacterales bacterium]
MFTVFEDEDFIRFKINTDIRHVNPLIHQAQKFFARYKLEDDRPLVLSIRELLTNAIEHGNRNMENLSIAVSLEYIGNLCFQIRVEDEGKGFDHENFLKNLPDNPDQARKWGLGLVKDFSDRMEFNDKGSSVSAWIRMAARTEFKISSLTGSDGREWNVIRPTGNLHAENAEKLRNALVELFETESKCYRFDLENVEDIDAVSLRVLIKFSDLLRDRCPDAEMEIANANPDIANLMRISCRHRLCRIVQ